MEWTDERVGRFWNFVSTQHGIAYFSASLGPALLRKFRPLIRRANTILDYGCGTGGFIAQLLTTGRQVAGTDPSQAALAAVAEKFQASTNFKGAFGVDAFARFEHQFDLVFMIEVIEHLDDAKLDASLNNVRRLLRPGGRIVVTTPNDEDMEAAMVGCPECGAVHHRWQHLRSWNAPELRRFLGSRGFRVIETRTCDLLLPTWVLQGLYRRLKFRLAGTRPANLVAIVAGD